MSKPRLEDKILLQPPPRSSPSNAKTKKYKVIFITGNPGLIEYYRIFLTHLHALLSSSSSAKSLSPRNSSKTIDPIFSVQGTSLAGFELSLDSKEERIRAWDNVGLDHVAPFSLNEVINAAEKNVIDSKFDYAENPSEADDDEESPGVILIGHSVGSFISLEIIERHRARLEGPGRGLGKKEPKIVGGICLFPTVVDIGKSENGRRLTALSKIPLVQKIVPILCSFLAALIPALILEPLVRKYTRFQPHLVEPTTAFLKSPHGIRQALHMGMDEMRQITTDKWGDEIWGAAHPSPTGNPRPKLFFYFGEKDHWVSDETKKEVMKLRGRNGDGDDWKPHMEIDKLGIPHAFPDNFSVAVAEKVAKYVLEIVDGDV